MYKKIVLIVAVVMAIGIYAWTRHYNSQVDARLVQAYNSFGCRVFKNIVNRRPHQNVLISPASASMNLALLCNGAHGKTKEVIRDTLQIGDLTLNQVNQGNCRLLGSAQELDDNMYCTLAHSLWTPGGVPLNPDYTGILQRCYSGDVRSSNLDSPLALRQVNSWVSKNTHGVVNGVVGESYRSNGLLVMGSSYLKSNWAEKVHRTQSQDRPFFLADGTQITAHIIRKGCIYGYQDCDLFVSVRLSYAREGLSLYIFQPNLYRDLQRFFDELNVKNWDTWMANYHEQVGVVSLPLFSLSSRNDLKPTITDLGGGMIFDSRSADFRGMAGGTPLWVGDFLEQDVVDDASEVLNAPAGDGRSVMIFQSFFFAIRDDRTGLILSMGYVENPNQN